MRLRGMTWAEIAAWFRDEYQASALAAWRLARGWTRQEAARQFTRRWPDQAKTPEHFGYWENWPSGNGFPPHLFTLVKLAELYQCAVSDLLDGIGDFRYLDEVANDRSNRDPEDERSPAAHPDTLPGGMERAALPTQADTP